MKELLESKVKMRVGLKNQGHIPTVEKMLSENCGWEQIGQKIGWIGSAVAADYGRYARKENEQLEARCAKFGDALILANKNSARRGKQRDEYKARCVELEGAHKAERQDRLRLQDRFIELESEKAELDIAAKEFQKSIWRLVGEKAQQQERIDRQQWALRQAKYELQKIRKTGRWPMESVLLILEEETQPTPHPTESENGNG